MLCAGISVRFMNANLQGDNIRDSLSAANLVARCQFSGMTPLGTQMYARILKPLVEAPIANRTMQKPILVITITDGEPTSEPESKIVKVIKGIKAFAAKSQYGAGAVAFEFAQVTARWPYHTLGLMIVTCVLWCTFFTICVTCNIRQPDQQVQPISQTARVMP